MVLLRLKLAQRFEETISFVTTLFPALSLQMALIFSMRNELTYVKSIEEHLAPSTRSMYFDCCPHYYHILFLLVDLLLLVLEIGHGCELTSSCVTEVLVHF